LSDDIHSMHIISIGEAHDWIQEYSLGYKGPQSAEVRSAIKTPLDF